MRFLLLTFTILLTSTTAFAQKGKIEGKVTDAKTGQALERVSVVVKQSGKGTASGVDGRYSILIQNEKFVSVIFSYGGASQQIDSIEIKDGAITTQDVAFKQREKTEEGVVVRGTSTARKETAASLITFQKNTNTVASVISAETIRRSPDRNTGEILKRTPGTSIQDGKFIIVRGLADRYNQAMLNGILLTSTEPDRKTFSFDLIPAQMIDNIIINKAFVPEYPGEWAGGLIQVNTKDIPAKNFFNIQLGTGFNTQTTGKAFYKDAQAGKTDWLGIDDGTRRLPASYTTKSNFDTIGLTNGNIAGKALVGQQMRNSWMPSKTSAPLNASVQLNGGFTGRFLGKKLGGSIGISYNKTYKNQALLNRNNNLDDRAVFGTVSSFEDSKYIQETTVGGLASLSVQLNSLNKISAKALVNVNGNNAVLNRLGYDRNRGTDTLIKGTDFTFKQNAFFTTQVNGEHGISKNVKLKWYGAFNILDGFIPDQKRLAYSRENTASPYEAIISNSLSQQSGSRVYQSLSDYIYTGGADVAYNFTAFGKKNTLKTGYMIQVKDRLYDAQLFAIYLPSRGDLGLKKLGPDKIFAAANFGNGLDTKFGFDAIKNRNFRYMANTILNAGYIQLDNPIGNKLRAVWGLRVENYDQLIGSNKKSDARYFNTNQTDFMPGVNLTYKLNNKTNIRVSASQTVIRPELRELASLSLYDFELNASVNGDPNLKRTKIINTDVRYELYPRAGEVLSVGGFFKRFKNPIEQFYNEDGGGSFSFINPESAYSFGVEIEYRKKLDVFPSLKNFTVQSNISLINSNVKDAIRELNRPLQGQSSYVINAGLLYDLEKYGINATMLFNMIGRRIYLVGGSGAFSGSPNVWELPRPLLDFQIAKKVLKTKGEIKLNISDIINQKQVFYQNNTKEGNFDFNKKTDAYRFTRVYGTSFSLTFNYAL
jgi:TonB-dependent receptor